jgi:hypothetical protein
VAPAYSLAQFGSLATPAQADAAFSNAQSQLIAAGGGLLLIPAEAPAAWKPRNNGQGIWLNPAPPAPSSKGWGKGPGVTVIDCRTGTLKLTPPQVTGMEIRRVMDLPKGQSLPHWGYQPLVSLKNTVLNGSNSYRDWLQEAVKAGKARRFYVPTIRGLFPGAFMDVADYSGIQRLYVQSLGYEAERKMWYFVADTEIDVPRGALIHNKNHVNIVRADTWSHNENQTFDVMMWRHNYSQGDNYLIDAKFAYMGDNHSSVGDENCLLFAAYVYSDKAIFRGAVESWNPVTGELVYKAGAKADTLGSGRPLINLNPAKWITSGTASVAAPGGALLGWGGSVFSTNADWTSDVIGRYLAIDEPDEVVPGGDKVRRWWLITGFSKGSNDVRYLSIQRHWWGAKNGCSIGRLYKQEHYTFNLLRPQPLRYIIAPGANVSDVSEGVRSAVVNASGCPRRLRLAPYPSAGTAFDFAPGDPVEQAIGPDPFKPIPFRSWLWDAVPGIFKAPVFDVANRGVMRHAVLAVGGGSGSLEADRAARYDRNPPFDTMLRFQASARHGIRFEGDTGQAALLFLQPGGTNSPSQSIKWDGEKQRRLGVTQNGLLDLEGDAPLNLAGQSLSDASALSGGSSRPANLRGVKDIVPAGAAALRVTFKKQEHDSAYGVIVRPSWPADCAVTKQDAAGFDAAFGAPAPAGAFIQWILIR